MLLVLKESVRLSFAENGRKLFATMHIRNVTMEDDSTSGQLGSYECHAYAVNQSKVEKHGFSVNVVTGKALMDNR